MDITTLIKQEPIYATVKKNMEIGNDESKNIKKDECLEEREQVVSIEEMKQTEFLGEDEGTEKIECSEERQQMEHSEET